MLKKNVSFLFFSVFFLFGCSNGGTEEVTLLINKFFKAMENGNTAELIDLFVVEKGQEIPSFQKTEGVKLIYSVGQVKSTGRDSAQVEVTVKAAGANQVMIFSAKKIEGEWKLKPDIQVRTSLPDFIPAPK